MTVYMVSIPSTQNGCKNLFFQGVYSPSRQTVLDYLIDCHKEEVNMPYYSGLYQELWSTVKYASYWPFLGVAPHGTCFATLKGELVNINIERVIPIKIENENMPVMANTARATTEYD
jgi:hypothetical protein